MRCGVPRAKLNQRAREPRGVSSRCSFLSSLQSTEHGMAVQGPGPKHRQLLFFHLQSSTSASSLASPSSAVLDLASMTLDAQTQSTWLWTRERKIGIEESLLHLTAKETVPVGSPAALSPGKMRFLLHHSPFSPYATPPRIYNGDSPRGSARVDSVDSNCIRALKSNLES